MPYKSNAKQKAYQNQRYQYRRNVLRRYKIMRSCDQCGYNRLAEALEFHHLRDKRQPVCMMMLYSWQSIKDEIAKCILLCANCHREASVAKR